ncbi:MAG: hypothetical protein HQL88_01555 [Magnetococcales bacterium]|nr:hypothetical protein [Magnetococcales bacterium]
MRDWLQRWKKDKKNQEFSPDTLPADPRGEEPDWDNLDREESQPQESAADSSQPSEEVATEGERGTSKAADLFVYWMVLIMLLILVPATVISTFEVLGRVTFLAQIEQEILQQRASLAELDKSPSKPETLQKTKSAALAELHTLEKFREAARSIIANGAIPLENDTFSFRDLVILKAKEPQGRSTLSSILQGESAVNKSKLQEKFPFLASLRDISLSIDHFNDLFFGFICNYSSNALMALSLIFSSMIGSLSCYFRKGPAAPVLLRHLISGLVMGFLVYLTVKGGQGLFMPGQGGGIRLSLDLYGASLLAFVAGVVADQLFRLFRAAIGWFDRRSA